MMFSKPPGAVFRPAEISKMHEYTGNNGPLVTILMPTFNRRRYFPIALASAVNQAYRNIEIVVVNDGGEDISDIVNSFADERIVFINRQVNRGKPYSLNDALARAKGKYVCYLDDDDMFYPIHVQKLVNALESQPSYQAAYSDLYKVHCTIDQDGNRTALSKTVEISRDFDRYFLMYFNHVLHVSLMHRRDLLEKTGLYNENLQVMIDWDMTRRLAFFTDFIHIHDITGEFYGPVGDCDRISVKQRKDPAKYLQNIMSIRMARPPKPWPKMKDLSIIYAPDLFDHSAVEILTKIWVFTFHAFKVVVPIPRSQIDSFKLTMSNLVRLPVDEALSRIERIDATLAHCDGEYIAVVPTNHPVTHAWVEDPLYALIGNAQLSQAFFLDNLPPGSFGAVFRSNELLAARKAYPYLDILQSAQAAGIVVRNPIREELPFKLDDLLEQAKQYQADGDCKSAARIYQHIGANCGNTLWMETAAANCYFKAGMYSKSLEIITAVNNNRPIIDTLVLESRIYQKMNDFERASRALEQAKSILQGTLCNA